ncbi:MAG TPA: acyl carrier protein [Chthoniobacter sp.]|jgi:acyl carrier protein
MATQPIPQQESLEQQLVQLVSEKLLETQPGFNADSNLYDSGLDSMAIMQLLILIEEEFGVALPESELTRQNFSTVRSVAGLIRARSASSAKG